MWTKKWLFRRIITNYKIHYGFWWLTSRKKTMFFFKLINIYFAYIVKISYKNLLLYRSYVLSQEVEPVLFKSHLIHMYISCRNIFIASSESRVLSMIWILYKISFFKVYGIFWYYFFPNLSFQIILKSLKWN
jgi:hypothetical protein